MTDILFWILVIVFLVAVESVTNALLGILFVPPALACLCLAALRAHPVVQAIVFLLLSLLMLAFLPKISKKVKTKVPNNPTQNGMIGQHCRLKADTDMDNQGSTVINGILWSVSASEPMKKDEAAQVIGMKGNTLLVVPENLTSQNSDQTA